ncbi:hypothetical protein [Microbacterium sp. A93]
MSASQPHIRYRTEYVRRHSRFNAATLASMVLVLAALAVFFILLLSIQ